LINATEQMIARNMIVELEEMEECVLAAINMGEADRFARQSFDRI
jgi:hypothetical protein